MPVFKGLDQNLEKSPMLCRCYGVLSAYHGRSAFFSGCVSGSTTEENSDQDKSDTSGLLESCLSIISFSFFLFMVQQVGLQMRCATGLDAA
jgi:hypothetical protein